VEPPIDLQMQLRGDERIMQELFGDNPQVRKLRDDYMTQVIRKDLQETILVEDASRNFRKISKKNSTRAITYYERIRTSPRSIYA
jgi:hypothetical protein